ncbi:MAG TPA: hypothetical protein VN794_23925, partial [Methylomirabilota bacterium]|nr:hypothetical protein [Methylomirabilota bacterium]
MKKRKLLSTLSVLSVPAAALMLGSSQGAQIGINFQADWSPYTSYSGKPVTATALGIDPGGWFNMLPVSTGAPAKNSQVLSLPGGKSLLVSWSQANSWTSGIDADSTGTNVPPGIDEVLWGYLDDPSPGFSVTLSGLRSFCSDYTLQTIAASDGASGFANVQLQNLLGTQSINYTNDPAQFFPVGGAGWATSTVSSAFVTLNGNDSVTIKGDGRNGSVRSTLAGIILSYTPGGANPPLI